MHQSLRLRHVRVVSGKSGAWVLGPSGSLVPRPCGAVWARWGPLGLVLASARSVACPHWLLPRSFRVFPESLAHRARTLGPIGPGAVWAPLGPLGPLGLVLPSVRSVARPSVLLKDEILHHLWVVQLPMKS